MGTVRGLSAETQYYYVVTVTYIVFIVRYNNMLDAKRNFSCNIEEISSECMKRSDHLLRFGFVDAIILVLVL